MPSARLPARFLSTAAYCKKTIAQSLRILQAEDAQSFQEIKQSYFKVVKRVHPDIDKNGDNSRINAILDAYRNIERLYRLNPDYFDKLLRNETSSDIQSKASFNAKDVALYEKVRQEIEELYFAVFKVKMDDTFSAYIAAGDAERKQFDNGLSKIKSKHLLMHSELMYLLPFYFEHLRNRARKNRDRESYSHEASQSIGRWERFFEFLEDNHKLIKWFCSVGLLLAVGLLLPEKLARFYNQIKSNIEEKRKRSEFKKKYSVPEIGAVTMPNRTDYLSNSKLSDRDDKFFNLGVVDRVKNGVHSKFLWGDRDKRERQSGLDEAEFLIHSTIRKDITLIQGKGSSSSLPKYEYKKHTQQELEEMSMNNDPESPKNNVSFPFMVTGTRTHLTCIHVQVCEGAQEALKKFMVSWDDVRYQLETQGFYSPPNVGFQFKGNFEAKVRADKQLNLELVPKKKISMYDLYFDYGAKINDCEERNVFKIYDIYPPFINEPVLFKIREKSPYFDQIKQKSNDTFKRANGDMITDLGSMLRDEIYEDVWGRVHKGAVTTFGAPGNFITYADWYCKSQLRAIQGPTYWKQLITLQEKMPTRKRELNPYDYFIKYGRKDRPPFTYYNRQKPRLAS